MAFTTPTFNLLANIFDGGGSPVTPRLTVLSNLAFGRRTSAKDEYDTGHAQLGTLMYLLLPALTDIRGGIQGVPTDVVEVPAGSGRFYNVFWVEDSAKGFPNEHRIAVIAGTDDFGNWPIPMP